jgi:hypothetical protein
MPPTWIGDPALKWNERFRAGDVVRLASGEVAVVHDIKDCSPDGQPPRWEMYLVHRTGAGVIDVDIFDPWAATPDPSDQARAEAQALGLLEPE